MSSISNDEDKTKKATNATKDKSKGTKKFKRGLGFVKHTVQSLANSTDNLHLLNATSRQFKQTLTLSNGNKGQTKLLPLPTTKQPSPATFLQSVDKKTTTTTTTTTSDTTPHMPRKSIGSSSTSSSILKSETFKDDCGFTVIKTDDGDDVKPLYKSQQSSTSSSSTSLLSHRTTTSTTTTATPSSSSSLSISLLPNISSNNLLSSPSQLFLSQKPINNYDISPKFHKEWLENNFNKSQWIRSQQSWHDHSSNTINSQPIIKLMIIGQIAVGKTSLCSKFCDNTFNVNTSHVKPTVFFDLYQRIINVEGIECNLIIYDLAGHMDDYSLTEFVNKFIGTCHCLIMAYDTSKCLKLKHGTHINDSYSKELYYYSGSKLAETYKIAKECNVQLALVGTKLDLIENDERAIEYNLNVAKDFKAKFPHISLIRFTSAKTGGYVQDFFSEAITLALHQQAMTSKCLCISCMQLTDALICGNLKLWAQLLTTKRKVMVKTATRPSLLQLPMNMGEEIQMKDVDEYEDEDEDDEEEEESVGDLSTIVDDFNGLCDFIKTKLRKEFGINKNTGNNTTTTSSCCW